MPIHRVAALALGLGLALLATAASAAAQVVTGVVIEAAAIYDYPDTAMTPLFIAPVDTTLRVKERNGDWLTIEYKDPREGRSEGYVLARTLRVADPATGMVDSSQPGVPRDVVGGRPQTRDGYWFNAGLGFGSLGCENCLERRNGLSGGVSVGGRVNDRWLLGVGTAGWLKREDDETLTVGSLDVRARFYPSPTLGFFVTGGAGLGSIRSRGDSELGLGIIFGVGWDLRIGPKVSLTPFYNGFVMRKANTNVNFDQLGIGITIH